MDVYNQCAKILREYYEKHKTDPDYFVLSRDMFRLLVRDDLGGRWKGDKLFRVRVVVVGGLGVIELGHRSKKINQTFDD